jgi:hypothetical protein
MPVNPRAVNISKLKDFVAKNFALGVSRRFWRSFPYGLNSANFQDPKKTAICGKPRLDAKSNPNLTFKSYCENNIKTLLLVNWRQDPPPGANLPVRAIFELNLSKIYITEVHYD